ncbi:chloride channel protein [Lichenifustis flavocetrariae]|uniref:Chloride channel protein n=1 Tax=Lichenifustis flavocetrariae TaxID=2949735 RepID=A0AA41YTX0_9HYPH|nr:chloride channel protein [Lichenifustis flavocetrariae]MCW6508504.1 chloride channel protein [Lichenifustis flavocetrariae]
MTARLVTGFRKSWWPKLHRRGLFLLGGLATGAAAVAMAILADKAQAIFFSASRHWAAFPFVATPAGFALAVWLTRRFAPGAQGSGIPQVIAAHHVRDPQSRAPLVSIRMGLAKIGLLTLGLLSGASAGREGPTVQVGAAIMAALGRLEPHRQPGLLIAGSAAGVAAAFNAPLAGIVFGIEEMSRSFEVRTSGLVVGTVIAAGLTSLAILGDYTYFGTTAVTLPFGRLWLMIPVAAVICGLLGGLFSRILIAFAQGLRGGPGFWIRRWPVGFAALCGLLVAFCGVASDGTIFGTGYEQSKEILSGADLPWLFGPVKLIATALSSISGIPGGIFSPSLAVGAGLGYDLHALVPGFPVEVLAILCMAAYLAGVVQAPMTSFVIVGEMTANHALVFPIMLSAVIGFAASRLVCPEGVYHVLSRQFLPRDPVSADTAMQEAHDERVDVEAEG